MGIYRNRMRAGYELVCLDLLGDQPCEVVNREGNVVFAGPRAACIVWLESQGLWQ